MQLFQNPALTGCASLTVHAGQICWEPPEGWGRAVLRWWLPAVHIPSDAAWLPVCRQGRGTWANLKEA